MKKKKEEWLGCAGGSCDRRQLKIDHDPKEFEHETKKMRIQNERCNAERQTYMYIIINERP